MAPRARKRIHSLQRAPDGSAFHKCEDCGISVAIALLDMHDCGIIKGLVKRSKVESEQVFNIDEQPRSPFCCFMESFKKTCKAETVIEISQRGFDAWQTMSYKERDPFIVQAEKVNLAYSRILLEESYNMSEVDDEADSATVGKFDLRWKPCRMKKRLVINKACSGSNELDSGNGFVVNPSKIFMEEAIGAEYGEGFETFRMDGPLKVDVDCLTEKLQGCFLQRIRHAMRPDEAFGLIFSWDNVVVDTRSLKLDAWRQLASEMGRNLPNDAHVQGTILHAAPDHILQKDPCWEKNEGKLERLKSRLLHIYYGNLQKIDKPMDGLNEWLDALYTASVPCALVSSLDRRNMLEILERMGLDKYFQAFVSEKDGMESIAHRFLSAAVKV